MSEDLQFQQRWEFRRRDSDVDSSSDNSKSISSGEPVLKKHKLVSSLISTENDETSGTLRSQAEGKSNPSSGDQFKIGKANKMHIGSSKKNNLDSKEMKRDSFEKVSKKKSKSNAYDPAALDDFKIFMESLLEDLKVARENLFVRMREELRKLMPDGTNSRSTRRGGGCRQENIRVQHQNNFVLGLEAQNFKRGSINRCVKKTANSTARSTKRKGSAAENIPVQHHAILDSGMKAQNCDGGSVRKSVKGKKMIGSGMHPTLGQGNGQVQHQDNFEASLEAQNYNDRSLEMSIKGRTTAGSGIPCEIPKDQVDQGQAIGRLISTEKNKGEMSDLSATKPKLLSNSFDQVASSMYLTLPTVLPEPSHENYRLDSSFCNYIQLGIAGNKMAMTSERANLLAPSAGILRGNLIGIQPEEKIGSFSQIGSRNVSSIDPSSLPSSSFSAGFPVPLHHNLNGYFSLPNQVSLENLPQENNILGLRMNGGAIRFSGNNAFPEHFVSNNVHSHLNYKADGGLMAFRTPDINDSHLFPN